MPGGSSERVKELLSFDLQLRIAAAAGLLLDDQDPSVLPVTISPDPIQRPLPQVVGFDEAGRGALAGPVTVACVSFELSENLWSGDGVAFHLSDNLCVGDSVAFKLPENLRSGDSVAFKLPENLRSGDGVAFRLPDGLWSGDGAEVRGEMLSATPASDAGDLCRALPHLDDSKRVTPKRREALYDVIRRVATYGVGHASAAEIDRMGIVPACNLAACRALARLDVPIGLALLDRGLSLPSGGPHAGMPCCKLTRGDARSFHIAAASILAKVTRDSLMVRLDERFAGYGLAKHKGYGTAAHRNAIRERGASAIHRRTFIKDQEVAKSQFC